VLTVLLALAASATLAICFAVFGIRHGEQQTRTERDRRHQ